MNKKLEKAFKIIDEISKKHFVGNKSSLLISEAEKICNIKFPDTYKYFLKKYGCGTFLNVEIYGLPSGNNLLLQGIPNAIWLNLDERKKFSFPEHLFIISENGYGGWYVLNTKITNSSNEYPVMEWDVDLEYPEDELFFIAEDFGQFLLDQLNESLEGN